MDLGPIFNQPQDLLLLRVTIAESVKERFEGLELLSILFEDLIVPKKFSEDHNNIVVSLVGDIKSKFTIEAIKDEPLMRKFRDFFWSLKIDPTKTRPASEALIRRVLRGRDFPVISPIVAPVNLASVASLIPIASFDLDKVVGDEILLRFSNEGENFFGIGMKEPKILKANELVMNDAEGLIAVYPHRDADRTKLTLSTKRCIWIMCGAPDVPFSALEKAAEISIDYMTSFCGGKSTII